MLVAFDKDPAWFETQGHYLQFDINFMGNFGWH